MVNMSPPDTPTMRKPPMAYSKRPSHVDNSTQQRQAFDGNDNEVKGEQAFDRISQQARGASDFRTRAQRAVNAIHGPCKTRARGKAAIYNSPPLNSPKATGELHRKVTHLNTNQGEKDIAEALARSLDDKEGVAPDAIVQYDDDVAKAIAMSLSTCNKLSRPSSAAGPYYALDTLVDDMEASVKCLYERTQEENTVAASQMAKCIESWQSTVSKVIYAAMAAEDERIEDLKAQLRFDQLIREMHQQEINKLNRKWQAKVLDMQHEWYKKMDRQKQTYEAQIAEQKSVNLSVEEQRATIEHSQPRAVKSSSSHYAHDEVPRLSREILAFQSEEAVLVAELGGSHHDQLSFPKQKAERLVDVDAVLRHGHKAKDDENIKEIEKLIQICDSIESLQGTAKPADASMNSGPFQEWATLSEPLPSMSRVSRDDEQIDCQTARLEPRLACESLVTPCKRKVNGDVFGQSEGAGRSRKRARARSME